MTTRKQRNRERALLEGVLRELGLTPSALDDGPDPPDFVMVHNSRRIAVEVTEYHSNPCRREVEETWEKILAIATSRREKHPQLNRLSVEIEPRRFVLPSSREQTRFVDEVVASCLRRLPSVGDGYSYDETCGSGFPLLEKYVKAVRLRHAHSYMDWSCKGLDWGGTKLTEPELCCALKKKAEKPPLGRDEYSAEWLFAIDGVSLSRILGIMWPETLNSYGHVNAALRRSPYKRVYLCGRRIALWKPSDGWIIIKDR